MPRVEGVPLAVEPRLEPGAEIHGIWGRRHPNITQIAGAIARGNIQASAEGDGEVGEVAADAGSFRVRLPGRQVRPRLRIVKVEVLVNKIADGLDPSPARRAVAE